MYRRDAEWAAERLSQRLDNATSPVEAVTWWIDEIFGFVRNARRAERVAVLGSIIASRAEGVEVVAAEARQLLIAPLAAAIAAGVGSGDFRVERPAVAADLVAAAGLHAAGLAAAPRPGDTADQKATTASVCALSARRSDLAPDAVVGLAPLASFPR